MDFIFQGFQSSLPVWAYLLIFIGTCLLAWWSYRDITGIRTSYRYTLVSLRSAAFFVLLLLLLNPFLKTETPYFEKPTLLVMLDNSASTGIQKKNYRGIESYREVLDQLNFDDSSSVDFDFFSIGNEILPSPPESLTFDADQTNLSATVDAIKANQTEASAVVLISDGIYTQGQNPVFEAQNLEVPIFTIGLGDTTAQKDVLVSSVSTNSTGFLNTIQQVTARISSLGFEGETFPVELVKGEEVIATQSITPSISHSTQEVNFELPLNEEGLQQFRIRVPHLTDEWTDANNVQRFSVDVKDDKQNILSLAFEIHPDVKALRSLLLQDQNTNLINRTWLRGTRFIEGNFAVNPDTLDLVVMHGYPASGLSDDLRQNVQELLENVPFVIAATPLFSPRRFEEQLTSLPVSVIGTWDFVPVSLNPELESTGHPIMELPAVTYDRLPRLSAPVENLESTALGQQLFSSSFQGEETEKPLLVVRELGNKRVALVNGFGWFQLTQSAEPEIRNFAEQLWLNIVSWTATDPENQLLEVQPAQTSFSGSEAVIINAFLNNERGEAESDATVDISVSSEEMEEHFYAMENEGNGQYQLNLGTMPEGLYSFEATARKGTRTIESRSGEFSVARSNAEFLDISRNEQLLRQLSQRSGGEYLAFDSITGFWGSLEQKGLLDQQKEVRTTFFYPYQQLAWFIIVLVLLCSEWILRKYLSLP